MKVKVVKNELREDEIISPDNVMRIGERIACKALKTVLAHSYNNRLVKLYLGLVTDMSSIKNPEHIFSDGYDFAQEAACFLCNYLGKPLNEVCAYDVKGRLATINKACFSRINQMIMNERKNGFMLANPESSEVINLSVPFTVGPTIEEIERQYDNLEMLIQRMQLTKLQHETLMCFLSDMSFTEIAKHFYIEVSSLCGRRYAIQRRYIKYIGKL